MIKKILKILIIIPTFLAFSSQREPVPLRGVLKKKLVEAASSYDLPLQDLNEYKLSLKAITKNILMRAKKKYDQGFLIKIKNKELIVFTSQQKEKCLTGSLILDDKDKEKIINFFFISKDYKKDLFEKIVDQYINCNI